MSKNDTSKFGNGEEDSTKTHERESSLRKLDNSLLVNGERSSPLRHSFMETSTYHPDPMSLNITTYSQIKPDEQTAEKLEEPVSQLIISQYD